MPYLCGVIIITPRNSAAPQQSKVNFDCIRLARALQRQKEDYYGRQD